MNDKPCASASVALGKCWQTSNSGLVFVASFYCQDPPKKEKGFLILDVMSHGASVRFQKEKPTDPLNTHTVAALIRKHCPSSKITGLALNDQGDDGQFIRLRLQTPNPSQTTYLVISQKPHREIDFIVNEQSLARLQPQKTFTIKKQASEVFLSLKDLDNQQFEIWISSLVEIENLSNEESREPKDQTLSPSRRQARDKLSRRIRTLKKTLLQEEKKLPDKATVEDLKKDANLLAKYLWMVKPEDHELTLDAAQTGDKPRTITLDPDKSAGENLDKLFIRIKKLERSLAIGQERTAKLHAQIQTFEEKLSTLKNPDFPMSAADVAQLLSSLGLAPSIAATSTRGHSKNLTKHLGKSSIGRRFLLGENIYLIVGRSAKESDQLVKEAKSSDWWVHIAGGGHGSHVIISGRPSKELPTQDILRSAGILALHFSDRSRAFEGEVHLTRRRFLRKTKGLSPGLWLIDKAETMIVRYNDSELNELFTKELRAGIQRHKRDP